MSTRHNCKKRLSRKTVNIKRTPSKFKLARHNVIGRIIAFSFLAIAIF